MPSKVDFADGAESSTTPVLSNIAASEVVQYADDSSYEAATQGAPFEGNLYYNTTIDKIKYYSDGAWRILADTDSIQVFTNKTVDGRAASATGNDVRTDADKIEHDDTANSFTSTEMQGVADEAAGRLDANEADINDLETLSGVPGDADLGTFTGTTIPDSSDNKEAFQALETAVEARIPSSEKGANNGVAPLNGSGTIDSSYLPTSLMDYSGDWDASSNTPTLDDTDTGEQGTVYRVTAAGTVDFGAGNITFAIGDWVYNNGTVWGKSDEQTLPDTDALPEGSTNLYYTEARVNANTNVTANTAKVSFPEAPEDGNQYARKDAGWEQVEATGGSGTGKKNYFVGGDFEEDAALATTYDDSGSYVDGDGGSPSVVTVSRNTTTPLSGTGDLLISKAVSDAAGEGVTFLSETIDRSDLGKDFNFEFNYDFTDANYTSGDIQIKAYDVTNSEILPVVVVSNMDDDAGLYQAQSRAYGKVLMNSTTDEIRLSVHFESDSNTGSASSLYIDDVQGGPSGVLVGFIGTEWKSEVLPIYGSVSDPTKSSNIIQDICFWRRVGDTMEIQYFYRQTDATGAAIGSGTYSWPIPDGKTIDSTKHQVSDSSAISTVGSATTYPGSGGPNQTGSVTILNSTRLALIVGDLAQGDGAVGSTFIPITGAAVYYSFKASVAIAEWSAGNLLSANEASYQTVKVAAAIQTGESLTADTTDISFGVTSINSHNAWDGTTFTAPSSGTYDIEGLLRFTASANRTITAYINTVASKSLASNAYNGILSKFSGNVYLDAGDELTFRSDGSDTTATGIQSNNWITIESRPDFTIFGVYGETDLVEAGAGLIPYSSYSITVGQWGDLSSITLSAGEWDLNSTVSYNSNGATSTTIIRNSIALVSGNALDAGATFGIDYLESSKNGASGSTDVIHLTRHGLKLTEETTVYLKGSADVSMTNLRVAHKISARKIK